MVLRATACVGNQPCFLVTHSVEHRVRCQFFDDWQVFRMSEQVKCDAL